MDRSAGTSLLVLFGVLLALAGPIAAGVGVDDTAMLRRLMMTRLEDGVAPELTVDVELHRRVLAGGNNLASGVLTQHESCQPSCPARGGPYTSTGRGCNPIYGCNPGH